MKLSEMKAVLAAHDLRLTKSLGQNFLHDRNQLLRIVEAAELTSDDRVLEIGPGLGPLTELLRERAHTVLAIEKDARLIKVLQERFQVTAVEDQGHGEGREDRLPGSAGLHLVHGDALSYLHQQPRDWRGWKLVSNLPYSVASPMLVELAQAPHGPERLVATLQLEVVRRLAASSGSPDYGVLTLLVQLQYEPRPWFKIPASCFFPEPDVDSACLCLVRRSEPLLPIRLRETFARVVKRSFSQRRKMMAKLLKADWSAAAIENALEQIGVSPQARAETLDLRQFVRLTELLTADSAG